MLYITDNCVFLFEHNIFEYFFGNEIDEEKWYCNCKYSFIWARFLCIMLCIISIVTLLLDLCFTPFYSLYHLYIKYNPIVVKPAPIISDNNNNNIIINPSDIIEVKDI